MRSIFLATIRNRFSVFEYGKVLFLFLLMLACFASSLPAGPVGQPSPVDNINSPVLQGIRNGVMTSGDACPTREELITKTRTLQMPFIANNGQMDEQVRFYAKTFGGTVFVTKEGEIVYALPDGRGGKVVSGLRGQAPLVRAESEFVTANTYSPLLHADSADCPPDRVIAKSLLAAYIPELQESVGTRSTVSPRAAYPPGLQEGTDKFVGTRRPCPSRFAHLSGSQESTDKQSLSMPPNPQSEIQIPKSSTRAVALKEQLVGGKINEIKGGAQAITTVSYFKGNDPSKWKSSISTYEVVDMGEVYKGIDLSLKAHGNNVEKFFTVKPGANPEQIKIRLDGVKECGIECPKSKIQNPKLQINNSGELVAETELGPVKFTKPVAYQEIDGKRVEVECEYTIADCGVQNAEYETNPQSPTSDSPIPHSEIRTPHSEYGFTVASYDKTKDLIIDPLLASTFLGGAGDEYGRSITLDTSGNIYVAGHTKSTDFPATSGAYDTSFVTIQRKYFKICLTGN